MLSLKSSRNCHHVGLFQQDFEACTQALHRMGYSNPQFTAARGTSAGGLIVGAVCNRSPGLFKAAILRVGLQLIFNYSGTWWCKNRVLHRKCDIQIFVHELQNFAKRTSERSEGVSFQSFATSE